MYQQERGLISSYHNARAFLTTVATPRRNHSNTTLKNITSQVTDQSLEYLAEHCQGLQSLTIPGCERVSDKGLTKMLKRCRNITALNVRGVSQLTEVRTTAQTFG